MTIEAVAERLSEERLRAILDACGVPGRVGVYHCTNAQGDIVLDANFARDLIAELIDLRTASIPGGGKRC